MMKRTMVRRPPTRSSILIAVALLVAFVGWTWLTFTSDAALAAFDQRTAAPPLDPRSATAQIAAALRPAHLAGARVRGAGRHRACGRSGTGCASSRWR